MLILFMPPRNSAAPASACHGQLSRRSTGATAPAQATTMTSVTPHGLYQNSVCWVIVAQTNPPVTSTVAGSGQRRESIPNSAASAMMPEMAAPHVMPWKLPPPIFSAQALTKNTPACIGVTKST
jgi:hypothetical protein